ncbi:hypothetical protein K466DRAFT_276537 [Polyporus arcularius HHB13444]|uniref:Uncharacterized protein n=1 Tax=Polyporus arcularius HHB13444 TaxID=1314778 RepID=A0A5C3P023_9APHY|nr:hypothetical protein K466DRAFT_276537 [Polyporus arcularius HHB13444]
MTRTSYLEPLVLVPLACSNMTVLIIAFPVNVYLVLPPASQGRSAGFRARKLTNSSAGRVAGWMTKSMHLIFGWPILPDTRWRFVVVAKKFLARVRLGRRVPFL